MGLAVFTEAMKTAANLCFSSFGGTARLVPSHQGSHLALRAPWEVACAHNLPQGHSCQENLQATISLEAAELPLLFGHTELVLLPP